MIYDRIENIKTYNLPASVVKVMETIASENLEVGRHEFEDGIFALVQEYTTKAKEDCKMEAHKKYVDIQAILQGEETFGYAYEAKSATEYNPDKDIYYLETEDRYINLVGGEFVMVWPQDFHRPKIGDGGFVRKVVVKVPLAIL